MAYKSQPTVTRPANTTAYTAGDVVGGAIHLKGLATDRDLLITTAALAPNIASVTSGMTSFRYALYDRKPASDLADNAVYDLTAADLPGYLGYIDVGSPADSGANLFCQVDQVNKQVRSGPDGVWMYIITNGAYTPGSAEVYTPTVWAIEL